MRSKQDLSVAGLFTRRDFLATLGVTAGWMALGNASSTLAGPPSIPPANLDSLVGRNGVDWNAVRRQFQLSEGLVYMNNGSLGPSPAYVVQEAFKAWEKLEQNPVEEGFGALLERAEAVRPKAAAFLGCSKDEIAITQNTTEGMNAIAQGLNLQPGQRVLTTDHEHPGGLVGWQYFAKRNRVVLDTVHLPLLPRNSDEVVHRIEALLTKQTRVISISHVTYTTGLQLPIAEIATLAKANGCLLVVDGAQAPGGLVVNVKKLGCHAYATSAHKWLLAPKGTGLLYISDEAKGQIDPLVLAGGYRVYTANTGTRNIPGIIGLGAAIDFLDKLGKEIVEKRVMEMCTRLHALLKEVTKVKVLSAPAGNFASPLVTFELPKGVNHTAFAETLKTKHGVITRVISSSSVNGIRVSTHVYNSETDIEKLIAALRKELA